LRTIQNQENKMSKFVRTSKVRHLFGKEEKAEQMVTDIRVGRGTGDHQYIKGNSKFWACAAQGGGGSLYLVPLTLGGKLPRNTKTICGHKAQIFDFDFNPFHDQMIATGSDDSTVKIWGIPSAEGLTEDIKDPLVDLADAHMRKVTFVLFHPTASNILASGSADHTVKLWDIESGDEKWVGDIPDLIQDLKFSYTGNLIGTTCKDKNFRMYDPRASKEATMTFNDHAGAKCSKMTFLGDSDRFITCGFSKSNKREFKIWDIKDVSKPLHTQSIDNAAGVMLPHYDPDIDVLYIGAKGDGNIRFFELSNEAPFAYDIGQYRSTKSQKGLCVLPKKANNVIGCEVTAFLKLHPDKVERIAMTIPRKSDRFQADIFPDAPLGIPSCTADEWFAGADVKPMLSSMNPKDQSDAPTAVAELKVKKSRAELEEELKLANTKIAELEAEIAKLKV
jgi:coronin-1B/1C/6